MILVRELEKQFMQKFQKLILRFLLILLSNMWVYGSGKIMDVIVLKAIKAYWVAAIMFG